MKDSEPQTIARRAVSGAAVALIIAAQLNVPAVLDALGTSAERPRLDRLLAVLTGE